MSELLAGTTLTAEQRDYLEAVHYSAESLLGIINDVLDVSKIEAGKVKIDPAPFDLREWFDDLLRPLAFRAHRQGLDFAGTLRGEVVSTVVADADRLRQVLINLIGNAIKFTKQGEIEVAIEVVMDVGDSHSGTARLCFSVRDSGIGIPAEKQNLIFESFTQADGSISRRYGGSGLGLTISSQFVRLMGGELEVKSSTGGGSTFRFAVRVPVTRSVAGRVLASKKVLVADRPGVSRHALENLLAELGAETTTAGSDAEALAMAGCAESGRGFDMVLIDSRVASAGLANLARSLQENGAFQGKVVLMETLVDRQSPGFDPDVPGWSRRIKPLRRADLAEIVGGGRESDALAKSRQDADGVPLPAGLHALVVEDNTVNQRVITGLLKKKGYRVTVAPSGEDAIACATRGRFDLILMDIQMPGMSGIETTALLRSREAGSGGHCPIVALTANAMKGDREKYIAAGMDDYLSKPIRSDELYRVLSRFTACASPEQARNAVADEPQPQPMN